MFGHKKLTLFHVSYSSNNYIVSLPSFCYAKVCILKECFSSTAIFFVVHLSRTYKYLVGGCYKLQTFFQKLKIRYSNIFQAFGESTYVKN